MKHLRNDDTQKYDDNNNNGEGVVLVHPERKSARRGSGCLTNPGASTTPREWLATDTTD